MPIDTSRVCRRQRYGIREPERGTDVGRWDETGVGARMRLIQKKSNRRFYDEDKMSLEDTKEVDACACKCIAKYQ